MQTADRRSSFMDPWASNGWADEDTPSSPVFERPAALPRWDSKSTIPITEENGWGASPSYEEPVPAAAEFEQQDVVEDQEARYPDESYQASFEDHANHNVLRSPSFEQHAEQSYSPKQASPLPSPPQSEAGDTAWSEMKLPTFSAIPGPSDTTWEEPDQSDEPEQDELEAANVEEAPSDGDDPWASAGTRQQTSTLYTNGMNPALLQQIVVEAKKLTEAAYQIDTEKVFLPPSGMGMNLESLYEEGGELSHLEPIMSKASNAYAYARFPFKGTNIERLYKEGLDNTAARATDILKGGSTRRAGLRTGFVFSNAPASPISQPATLTQPSSFVDLWGESSDSQPVQEVKQEKPALLEQPIAPAPSPSTTSFFGGFFGRKTATPEPNQKAEIPQPSLKHDSIADLSLIETSPIQSMSAFSDTAPTQLPSRSAVPSSLSRSSIDVSNSTIQPPNRPSSAASSTSRQASGVSRFFGRFNRTASTDFGTSRKSLDDDWLGPKEAAFLDAGGVEVDYSQVDEPGGYAMGGLLDMPESPQKKLTRNVKEPKIGGVDDLFAAFGPTAVQAKSSDARSATYDPFDPLGDSPPLVQSTFLPLKSSAPISTPSMDTQTLPSPRPPSSNAFSLPLPQAQPSKPLSAFSLPPPSQPSSGPVPLLAPPPSSAAPMQHKQVDLFGADDDFGDFEAAAPTASQPISQPVKNNGAFSSSDLSFFDNL